MFHQIDDFRHGTVAVSLGRSDVDDTAEIDTSRRDVVAFMDVARFTFTR